MANKMKQTVEHIIHTNELSETINGEEIMGSSPFKKHQKVVSNIYFEIRKFLEKQKIGEIFLSPLDVIFEENVNRLQPDLIYINNENMTIAQDWIRGIPDAVIEIVSKGNFTHDTVIKRNVYEKYKVPEMWLVFPEEECIEIFVIENDRYELYSSAELTGNVSSKVITSLKIPLEVIFKQV